MIWLGKVADLWRNSHLVHAARWKISTLASTVAANTAATVAGFNSLHEFWSTSPPSWCKCWKFGGCLNIFYNFTHVTLTLLHCLPNLVWVVFVVDAAVVIHQSIFKVLDGPPCWLTLHVTSNASLLLKGEKFPTSERLGNLLLKEGRGCFESFICIIQWISAWIRLYSSTQMDLSGANINNTHYFFTYCTMYIVIWKSFGDKQSLFHEFWKTGIVVFQIEKLRALLNILTFYLRLSDSRSGVYF